LRGKLGSNLFACSIPLLRFVFATLFITYKISMKKAYKN
jgi:hypothetical protein